MKLKTIALVSGLLLTAGLSFGQRVRVVHASPDAPAVDIYVDGQKAFQDLPFGEYTDYAEVGRGQHELAVYVARTDTAVLRTSAFIDSSTDYTVLATGFVGGTPALDLLILADRNNTQPPAMRAKVRVVHAAPSAPDVDVYFTTPFAVLAQPTLTGVPFGAASGFLTVPTGMTNAQYQARVAVAGTQTVAIDSGRVVLPARSVRTYIALDPKEPGGSFQIIELLDRD